MKPVKKEAYHHGDLRSALVALALDRVRHGGAEGFSLREAARDAGVTSGAAYKHFADKDELLTAVAAEALKLLARRTLNATANARGKARLAACARAYIDFASTEPLLFKLAFSRYGAASDCDPPSIEDGDPPSAFEQLRMAARDLQPDPGKPLDPDMLALAWSVVHGAGSLISDGMWKKNDPRAEGALRMAFKVIVPGK